MKPEMITAWVAIVGLIATVLTIFWGASSVISRLQVGMGVLQSDVAGLKVTVQSHSDSKIAHDTILQQATSQMNKLEGKIDTLQSSSSEIARNLSVVAQLAEKVVPREELQAKFDAVNERFRILEGK